MDKFLTLKNWATFVGKRSYKDDKFVTGLKSLEKAGDQPQPLLDALDKVDSAATALQRENKGDKELEKYLKDLLAALDKARKQAASDLKEAQKKANADEDEDNDPAELLLGAKTRAAMKACQTGHLVQVLVSVAGQDTALMMSTKPISPTRKKLLAAHLGVSSGVKHLSGECFFEDGRFIFVLDRALTGLAKKLTRALLEQLGKRYKVSVRAEGAEESDEEGDGGDGAHPAQAPAGTAAAAAAESEAPAATIAAEPVAPAATSPTPEAPAAAASPAPEAPAAAASPASEAPAAATAPDARLIALQERMVRLDRQIVGATLEAAISAKVKALRQFADDKSTQGNLAAAEKSLDLIDEEIAKARVAATASGEAAVAGAAGADAAGVGTGQAGSAAGNDGSTTSSITKDQIKSALAGAIPFVTSSVAGGGIAAAALQAAVKEIHGLVGALDFEAAHARIQSLMDAAEAGNQAVARAHGGIDSAVSAWDGLRSGIEQHLHTLKQAALQAVREHNADPAVTEVFDEGEVERNLEKVHEVMVNLDARLSDRLHACRSKPVEERSRLVSDVESVIDQYEQYLKSDALLKAIDGSGFLQHSLTDRVAGVLREVRDQLDVVRA